MPVRKNIKTTWDLTPLLKDDDDPAVVKYRKATTKAVEAFNKRWRKNSDYLHDPRVAKQALDEIEKLYRTPGFENESFYFHLRSAQNTSDSAVRAKETKATEFSKQTHNNLQFFWLNLGTLTVDNQKKFLADNGLKPYRHALQKTFIEAKHRLSEVEERIISLKSSVAHNNWVQMTGRFLAKEQREVLQENGTKVACGLETLMTLTSSQNKKLRDASGKALNDIFKNHVEVAECEINSVLANKKIDDELRGYSRPDQARHLSDDINSQIVDAMLQAVSKHNNIAKRFYQLMGKIHGVKKLSYHERSLPYPAADKNFSFDQAAALTESVFEELDREFSSMLKNYIKTGRIDVYSYMGKQTGAFCASYFLHHPTYVMLNFTGKQNDVRTLAHEMGHAINAELIQRSQNALNFETPLSTAEVASTFMEDFITRRFLNDASQEQRLALMIEQLYSSVSSVFRQVACYRFEQDLHADYRKHGYLTSAHINTLFKKHMSAYMGSAADGCENWWVYWPHIRSFFYVYSYASGHLISKTMQAQVRRDKTFIGKVKTFLSAGTSQSPQAIFADMDIDITKPIFWENGVKEIDDLLSQTEALAKKLGKI